ncbi:MAG TPA: pitrilysin family protein [Isosphaeraceae bacterium]|jgi:predicted Zn-dependent peptidase|nr:pitrilysin family protein [Isosphaeraceae bacterium]
MYRKTTLENGIRVVTESMAEARTLSIGIVVDASPRDEPLEQSGLAHLTEHALFQGTSSRDALQIARLMDSAGGQMGAFTTRDYTCYHATVLDDYRTYVLDLFGDLLLNSTFPAPKLEREKQSILREIDAYRDAPQSRLDAILKAVAWPLHPLGRPIAGLPETVSALTREDVIYFIHENYLPNRIIIAAAGNVEHADFVAHVRDAFWRLLGQSSPAAAMSTQIRPAVACEHAPVNQAYFALGIPAHCFTHADRYRLHVLNTLLGGGISSRLFRKIREQHGLVYDIGSEYQAFRDNGMLVVEGSTSPEHLMPVLELTLNVLWDLATGEEPADDDELWKAKMQLRGHHSIAGESTHTRMSRLAVQELYFGCHLGSDEVLAQIEAVNREDLNRLAGCWLHEALECATIAVVGPEAPQHYGKELIERLLANYLRAPALTLGEPCRAT